MVRCFLAAFSLFCCSILPAQTIHWTVQPRYEKVSALNDEIFRVVQNGKVGLRKADGEIMLQPAADSISPFTEGKALVLFRRGASLLLSLVVHEDGRQFQTPAMYVARDGFYSEDRLPVYDSRGQYGFLDEQGTMAVHCNYMSVRPFSEGLSAVVKKKSGKNRVCFVDKAGVEKQLDKDFAKADFLTSFSNGEAVVGVEGAQYIINKYGMFLKPAPTRYMEYELDWKGRIPGNAEVSHDYHRVKDSEPIPYYEKGMGFGYKTRSGKILLSPQLKYAGTFTKGYAIAQDAGGHYGVLHVADDDFRFSQAYGESVVEDGDEPVNFQLDLPFGVKPESVILKVEYGNGLRKTFTLGKRDIKTTGNIFPAVLPIEDRKVTLTIDGLVMLEDTLGPVEPAPELAVSLVATSKRADKEGHFFFEVVFSNPGRKAVSIPIRVGGKRVVCGKKEVTIPAGGKTKVQGYSTDVTVREKRAIRIEYDGKVTDRIINVVPIVG